MNTKTILAAFRATKLFLVGIPAWAARTPSLLLTLMTLLVLAALAVGANNLRRADRLAQAMKVISVDCVPSIRSADQIRLKLYAMNVAVCDALLTSAEDPHAAMLNEKAQVLESLMAVTQNISHGEREREPIRRIFSGLGAYEGLVRSAASQGSFQRIASILKASNAIGQEVAPYAEQLGDLNVKEMDQATLLNFEAEAGIKSLDWPNLALLLLLVLVQAYLALRFRRLVNLPLLAATLALGWLTWSNHQRFESIKVASAGAVRTSFDSYLALSRIKTLLNGAKTDQTLFLLVLSREKDARSESFMKRFSRIISADLTNQRVYDQCRLAVEQGKKVELNGYLATVFNQVASPAEAKLTLSFVESMRQYLEVDAQVRNHEKESKHDAAVALALGRKPGESEFVFTQMINAVDDLMQLTWERYGRDIAEANRQITALRLNSIITLAAVLLLLVIGLRLRLAEYN
jgi:hypothetical protein